MPTLARTALEPRKSPVQARSAASVEAILDATLQVLLAIGKERLTTTRVAERAGVSVGTLYQYFPNKSALLQAVLERHLNLVIAVIERVCREQAGRSLAQMITTLIDAFFAAKMQNPRTSVALYAVSSDVDGARISQLKTGRSQAAIAAMLATAQPPLARDPELVAAIVQGAMVGVSRQLLENKSPEKRLPALREELLFSVCAYLHASSTLA